MAMVRRHWALALAIPILLAACALLLFQELGTGNRVRAQLAPTASPDASNSASATSTLLPQVPVETPEARAEVENYKRIQKLRDELSLTQQDLAAMGLSAGNVTNVLNAVKSFISTSSASLQNGDAEVQRAQQVLAEAARKIRVGPRDEAVIASVSSLKQNIATARIERDAVLGKLVAQVNSCLTSDQQVMWAAARSYAVASEPQSKALLATNVPPGSYRYVAGLNDMQIHKLQMLARQGGIAHLLNAGADTVSSQQLAQAQFVSQQQRIASSAVAAAEDQVLPVPALLRTSLGASTAAPPAMTKPSPK